MFCIQVLGSVEIYLYNSFFVTKFGFSRSTVVPSGTRECPTLSSFREIRRVIMTTNKWVQMVFKWNLTYTDWAKSTSHHIMDEIRWIGDTKDFMKISLKYNMNEYFIYLFGYVQYHKGSTFSKAIIKDKINKLYVQLWQQ